MPTVREPAVAGMFYPDSPAKLSREIDLLMSAAKPGPSVGILKGLIAPHAGYMYSGSTAARAYGLLSGRNYDAVIVIGPSHREYYNGVSVFPGDAYRTPLGDVAIHKEICADLEHQQSGIVMSDVGHRGEHSVEVQLPFLQKVLGEFSFVPLVMGDQKRQLCEALADRLALVAQKRNVLFVASSDLSHYYPYETAIQLDQRVIDRVGAFDAEGLAELFEHDEAEACGGGPIVSVMMASKKLGANRSDILFYCNSGDITGDKSRVVGYLSAALLQVN